MQLSAPTTSADPLLPNLAATGQPAAAAGTTTGEFAQLFPDLVSGQPGLVSGQPGTPASSGVAGLFSSPTPSALSSAPAVMRGTAATGIPAEPVDFPAGIVPVQLPEIAAPAETADLNIPVHPDSLQLTFKDGGPRADLRTGSHLRCVRTQKAPIVNEPAAPVDQMPWAAMMSPTPAPESGNSRMDQTGVVLGGSGEAAVRSSAGEMPSPLVGEGNSADLIGVWSPPVAAVPPGARPIAGVEGEAPVAGRAAAGEGAPLAKRPAQPRGVLPGRANGLAVATLAAENVPGVAVAAGVTGGVRPVAGDSVGGAMGDSGRSNRFDTATQAADQNAGVAVAAGVTGGVRPVAGAEVSAALGDAETRAAEELPSAGLGQPISPRRVFGDRWATPAASFSSMAVDGPPFAEGVLSPRSQVAVSSQLGALIGDSVGANAPLASAAASGREASPAVPPLTVESGGVAEVASAMNDEAAAISEVFGMELRVESGRREAGWRKYVRTGQQVAENFAALDTKSDRPVGSVLESSPKHFQATTGKEVAEVGRRVGTDTANHGLPMFAFPINSRSDSVAATPLSMEFAPTEISSVEAATAGDQPAAAEPSATARRAVEAVLTAADRMGHGERSTVNLRFAMGDAELAVRVELRDAEVHATFQTDSAELRAALTRECQGISFEAPDRSFRLAPPVISGGGGSSTFTGDASAQQRDAQQRRAGDGLNGFAPGPIRSAGQHREAEVSPVAARSSVLPTSLHLHTLA